MEQYSASIFRAKLFPSKQDGSTRLPNTSHYLAADTCNITEDLIITEQ